MGIYKLEIVKQLEGAAGVGTWRNTYHLNTPSIGDAGDLIETVANSERAIHGNLIQFLYGRVSDRTKAEATVTKSLFGGAGDQAFTGLRIPLWNVVVVNFADTGGGRMERKYYRVGLTEGAIDGTVLESTYLSNAQASMDELVSLIIAMCAPNGDTVVSASVNPTIGMRQQGWHRRKRPGFHRGYVPD